MIIIHNILYYILLSSNSWLGSSFTTTLIGIKKWRWIFPGWKCSQFQSKRLYIMFVCSNHTLIWNILPGSLFFSALLLLRDKQGHFLFLLASASLPVMSLDTSLILVYMSRAESRDDNLIYFYFFTSRSQFQVIMLLFVKEHFRCCLRKAKKQTTKTVSLFCKNALLLSAYMPYGEMY